ncbi:MAG: hypothetical protein INH41_03460 [Myxococcaceae bacterium]|nr:hypothetical protein [Myxococcaceae bacterium]MCA3011437.1 hypothetical protein [Myxococcaceae bacterium]
MDSTLPELQGLTRSLRHVIAPPGAGLPLDGGGLEPLASLYQLKDMAWAVYLQDDGWRLHVASGLEVTLNGAPTGGSALVSGDVIGGDDVWRFTAGPWPGPTDATLDAQTLAAPDDDALALVYRDRLLELGAPLAEALRRPVPRAEQARHLWPFARDVARGFVEARFSGPHVRAVVSRRPQLDLVGFADALGLVAPALPHLTAVKTWGLSADDAVQLALLLSRQPGLERVGRLETGVRGAFDLSDFRARDRLEAPPRAVRAVASPREGPARPLALQLVAWDGWTALSPLTSEKRVTLDADTALVFHADGGALVAGARGDVTLRRADDWVLEVSARTPDALTPRLDGLPLRGAFGVGPGDELELVLGLRCRLGPG